MPPRFLLILLLSAYAAAQIPDMPNIPGLDILNDPSKMGDLEKCGQYFDQNQAGQDACSKATEAMAAAGSWKCPEECKKYWEGMPDACDALMSTIFAGLKDESGNPVKPRDWFSKICSGEAVTVTNPPDTTGNASAGGVSVNYTGFASTFECDTAGGFSWVTLDGSLATLIGDGSAAAALNSTCNDPNTPGCCVQAPPSNLTMAQFGLGAPMIVQGVKLTAPSGECCIGGAGTAGNCTDGSGPCSERLIGSFVTVSNSSFQDVLQSPDYKSWEDAMALTNVTGDDKVFAGQSWLWGYIVGGNATFGLCNVVTEYDVTDINTGALLNNGTASIGCGLGVMGGKANVTVGGELAAQLGIAGTTTTPGGIGLAREKPQGSWLLLSRFEPAEPLTFCGVQVCAKPANATS